MESGCRKLASWNVINGLAWWGLTPAKASGLAVSQVLTPGAGGLQSADTKQWGLCEPLCTQIGSQVSPPCRGFSPAVERCWCQKSWHLICSSSLSLTFPSLSLVDQREMLLQHLTRHPKGECLSSSSLCRWGLPSSLLAGQTDCWWTAFLCHSVPVISRSN